MDSRTHSIIFLEVIDCFDAHSEAVYGNNNLLYPKSSHNPHLSDQSNVEGAKVLPNGPYIKGDVAKFRRARTCVYLPSLKQVGFFCPAI